MCCKINELFVGKHLFSEKKTETKQIIAQLQCNDNKPLHHSLIGMNAIATTFSRAELA